MIYALTLGSSVANPGHWSGIGVWTLLAFWPATVLLGTLDVALPRGDAVGVSGVLDVLALVLFGPVFAFVTCLIGIVGASLLKHTIDRPTRLRVTLTTRMAGLLGAIATTSALSFLASRGPVVAWIPSTLAIVVYVVTELMIVQLLAAVRTRRGFLRLVRGNLSGQSPLILAQISSGLLALIAYSVMREWSLVVVVALLLLIRQSYALLLDVKETYRTTVEVLVEVAESANRDLRGHADRTSKIAREIAAYCGLSPAEVERISYAALLHDMNLIAAGRDLDSGDTRSSSVLDGIPFFAEVVSVLRARDGVEGQANADESDRIAAFIVGIACKVDAGYYPRVFAAHHDGAVQVAPVSISEPLRTRVISAATEIGRNAQWATP